ncbi:hypothetical protein AA23498_0212 [Acetobacter nitrogenifigens DSM 23921 = NBRC 105050]|uniref:Hedgehog/Intein (Hint) domain-containing protein n=1 Tax=Acetobacter nitrogenifigens DSM 23921 = NBRC 105050 TaxID=1120919 RepID=A0A511XCY3_9PROT|nr:Hint domain-containing protein [Acetobacter nitrogenifigens]GBQ87768.1 hypothetical protein AA23498_0212 [Acetobacter nitrogenifigens DSM 23921 = NBRC 105050]GEN60735.1 hypothetical protein ANI02nite_26190 [Acetobacter nitrogenifigens DSM 23921 = NBRC 105050]
MTRTSTLNTDSALAASSVTKTTYASYTSGSGTPTNPYVLASNSGTITLKPGAWYVLPDNVSIGTVVTSEYNSSGSTGGINVNGAHLEIKTYAHVAGKIDMGTTGSILVLDNTSGKWSYQANMAGEDLSAGGDNLFTYPSLQNATLTNLDTKGTGIVTCDIPNGIGNTIGIAAHSSNSSQLVLRSGGKIDGGIPVNSYPSNPHGNNVVGGTIGLPVTAPPNNCTVPYYVDPNNPCQVNICFLAGSMIMTRSGEKAVETLVEGDDIAVLAGGETTYRPLVWLGRSHANVAELDFDQDAYPVRIGKGAFGPGLPTQDLLVTSEHGVYVDGGFVPVRMLVNDRSVSIERSITEYDYYHVELADHGVILSNGLPTESYLDTGNRGTFQNSVIRAMRPHFAGGMVIASGKSWEQDAAAPLVTDRETVEPIWKRLNERADELGLPEAPQTGASTSDPALRLVTEDGREIRPVQQIGNVYSFMVPAEIETVRIVSRTFRPSLVTGPFCDDRRDLGVLVGDIAITSARSREVLTSHLTPDEHDGWHGYEGPTARWTNGAAVVVLGVANSAAVTRMVEIEMLGAGSYQVVESQNDARVA